MSTLPVLKAKELIRVLLRLGFLKYHQVGSHAQFKHPDGRCTTVPIHQGKDIGTGTLRGIINDIGITVEDLIFILRKKKH